MPFGHEMLHISAHKTSGGGAISWWLACNMVLGVVQGGLACNIVSAKVQFMTLAASLHLSYFTYICQ